MRASHASGPAPVLSGEREAQVLLMSLLLDEIALATARLAEAGVESPRADAELIAAHVHNVKRGELHTVADKDFDARFWVDIGRRENREPLQHITGQAYFRYLEIGRAHV